MIRYNVSNTKKTIFHCRYNVSNTKKQIFITDTTYLTLKNNFSYFRAARKRQKVIFHTSAWRGNDLKEIIKESPANINLRGLYHSHSYTINTGVMEAYVKYKKNF